MFERFGLGGGGKDEQIVGIPKALLETLSGLLPELDDEDIRNLSTAEPLLEAVDAIIADNN